jgi:hypothetical protein
VQYKTDYETKYKEDVSTFGGHAYDAIVILAKAIETAGADKEKVRDAIEATQGFVGTAGIFNFSAADHNGLTIDAFEMLTVKGGKFAVYTKPAAAQPAAKSATAAAKSATAAAKSATAAAKSATEAAKSATEAAKPATEAAKPAPKAAENPADKPAQ